MKTGEALLDVNVLLSLSWPNHLHHRPSRAWFTDHCSNGWATCALTELGFIRISSNPRVFPDAVSPLQAANQLVALKKVGRHRFWPNSLVPSEYLPSSFGLVTSHGQVTDKHLLEMARANKGKMVSFDRGLARLLDPSSDDCKLLTLLS